MLEKNVRGHMLVVTGLLLGTLPWSAFCQEPQRNQHALLVGCTVYPNLAKRFHLVGPANDVLLAKKLLVEQFKFPEENVTILADSAGGADRMPTRANIERQWKRLAGVAKNGDQIVVMMAGHGTQSPQSIVDENNPEADGLDELFLPRDVGSWSDQVGTVENAIRDDDIRQWMAAITDKSASLWVIIDACHSGTMTRGAGDEVKREVRPEDLGVPEAALQKAYAIAEQRGTATYEQEAQLLDRPEKTRGIPERSAPADSNKPVVVALYASQSIEPTVEKKLPTRSPNRKYYGLLTYTLSEVLSQAESKMTYRELVAQIHRQYLKMGRTSPTPVLEGTDVDREVLGLEAFPQRSRVRITGNRRSGWKVNAGALSGLTAGSILALYPPAGTANADQVAGHVRISEGGLQALEASVEPCKYNAMPVPTELAAGMRGETVFVDYGDLRMKAAVDRATDEGDAVSKDDWQDLERVLDDFAEENSHLVQVVVSDDADWLLRYDTAKAKRLFLVPAAGWPGQHQSTKLPPLFGPAPTGNKLASWLNDSLTRIARAQTLLRVSAQGIEDAENVDIQIVRYKDATDKTGEPVENGRGQVKLYDGDSIGFQVENTGRDPRDVTILLIDSGYGIYPLFPADGETNRLYPGNKIVKRGTITSSTTGQERLVVIAVKGKPVGQPVNFAFLAQPTLERTREVAGEKNPVSELLIGAMFGGQTERTRGFATATVDDYSLYTRAWQTMPTKRPQ